MKTFKFLAYAALAVAFTVSASAQTTIRIVASNGDRTATQTAISKLLSPSAGGPSGTGWAFRGTSGSVLNTGGTLSVPGGQTATGLGVATGANFGAWNGRITATGTDVIIKVSYSGALAGIQAVAGDVQQRFVVTNGTGSGSVPNPLTGTTLGTDYELGVADFGFSTNFQSTSPYNGTFQGVTYNPIVEETVGVSPLGWYGSAGFPGSPVNSFGAGYEFGTYKPNVTTQLLQLLYKSGVISLAQITGDWTNHKNINVYATGRNVDAGQRFGANLEVGFGFSSVVSHWFPTFSVAQTTTSGITYGGTVGTLAPWPVAQQPGAFAVVAGNGGYNSGANAAAPLTAVLNSDAYKVKFFDPDLGDFDFLYPSATGGFFIGYITPGDATDRVLGGNGVVPAASRGVALRFNGVENTTANVKNGTYTAWLYNRILKRTSLTSGVIFTFANALRDQIATVDAVAGGGFIDDATNFVKRTTDGGPVQGK
jgi:hypothetical protein